MRTQATGHHRKSHFRLAAERILRFHFEPLSCFAQLLDYESRASEQVPLLMKLKQDGPAMTKAINSGDTDLSMRSLVCILNRLAQRIVFKLPFSQFLWSFFIFAKRCKRESSKWPSGTFRSHMRCIKRYPSCFIIEEDSPGVLILTN